MRIYVPLFSYLVAMYKYCATVYYYNCLFTSLYIIIEKILVRRYLYRYHFTVYFTALWHKEFELRRDSNDVCE